MKKVEALETGYRDLLRMALPISAGTALQFLVLLTDNFFLARHSEAYAREVREPEGRETARRPGGGGGT